MRSVIQDWAMELPLRMQSTMLLSMRGPDGCAKHNTAKALLRQLRSAVLVPAFPGQSDSFMGDQRGYEEWAVAEEFIDSHDEYPHHWLMHFIHAAEIVGQYHPDDTIRMFWWALYAAMCRTFHMNVENLGELDRRLADPVRALPQTPEPYSSVFGDDKLCECGHPYYRHFDTYEHMAPVGCKYCGCSRWTAPPQEPR